MATSKEVASLSLRISINIYIIIIIIRETCETSAY